MQPKLDSTINNYIKNQVGLGYGLEYKIIY